MKLAKIFAWFTLLVGIANLSVIGYHLFTQDPNYSIYYKGCINPHVLYVGLMFLVAVPSSITYLAKPAVGCMLMRVTILFLFGYFIFLHSISFFVTELTLPRHLIAVAQNLIFGWLLYLLDKRYRINSNKPVEATA